MELERRWVIVRHVGVDHAVLVANPVGMWSMALHECTGCTTQYGESRKVTPSTGTFFAGVGL
jgi:hypothetical protein